MKVHLVYAHPFHRRSRANRIFFESVKQIKNLDFTVCDLYNTYPGFHIEVEEEKQKLERAEVLILQHPFYWYNMPPLLKLWIDEVFELGWAYGPEGKALADKYWVQSITTGGPSSAYQRDGYNVFTMKEFLRIHEQTARLCNMKPLEPFITQNAGHLSDKELHHRAAEYVAFVESLLDGELPPVYSTL